MSSLMKSGAPPTWVVNLPRAPLAGVVLAVAALALGIALGLEVLPPGLWHRPGTVAHQMLISWDGGWYYLIAQNGYSWDAVAGSQLSHYQDVAFFPLYPLIESLIIHVTGSKAPILMILPGALFGFASVPVFFRLAQRLLAKPEAVWATLFYALYPAVSFFLMGYPTGLMNLLVMLSLFDIMDGRPWRAAFWCGLGTAAGPPLVFVAIVLSLDQGFGWISRRCPMREIPRLIGFGLLSISGLLLYVIYQDTALGHPFAFLHAQSAWGQAPPLAERLERLVSPHWYLHSIIHYSARSWRAFTTLHITHTDNYMFEIGLNKILVVLAIIGVAASFRLRPLVIPFTGLAVLLGYLWFIDTIQNAGSATRLLYPALSMFMGWALLLRRAPNFVQAGLLCVFGILLALNTGLVVAGYWVV